MDIFTRSHNIIRYFRAQAADFFARMRFYYIAGIQMVFLMGGGGGGVPGFAYNISSLYINGWTYIILYKPIIELYFW